ncbi:DUF1553 domain-containing protein [Neolewinella agarilytica]|uniref:Planctomycete cytochrome C n=1 Tax=Neolewinella agarilytica TaxID=478744 RepID=A0A1H9K500_9BACT|nr:DUF1553 domain-containing protein [Neolewinella agarilytica]SEQ94244.1 Planctomycete cytochrome C [Neolewinella agarilytica]
MQRLLLLSFFPVLLTLWLAAGSCSHEERISYNDSIRPIFNEKCIACHGGVKQSGGFGLVFREDALGETSSGKFAIVPGRPAKSEIVVRIKHDNPELRMPLEHAPLTVEETELIETWIRQGAEWEEHWAYLPVKEVEVPTSTTVGIQHPIDAFVRARLQKEKLAPAPRAQKRDLLRRLSFDLTGLPPSQKMMLSFLEDDRPEAYEEAVDALLQSPAFGEHWASKWLDLARYADSRGYERDPNRTIWPWRDWVIRAYNEDMPYDEFTLQQLAGDLLPEATPDQYLATAFHRNTLSNDEGGTSNEEYRNITIMDRVATSWEVWLGTSMACVQCHGHPYDPLRHEEYYRSYAFFNQSTDHDHVSEAPNLIAFFPAEEEKVRKLEDWVREHENKEAQTQVQNWVKRLRMREPRLRPETFTEVVGGIFTDRGDEDFLFVHNDNSFRLEGQLLDDIAAIHLSYRAMSKGLSLRITLDALDGPLLLETALSSRKWPFGTQQLKIPPTAGKHDLYFQFSGVENKKIAGIYGVHFQEKLPGEGQAGYAEVEAYIQELLEAKDSVRVPVMVDRPAEQARTTRIFTAGNWLVPADTVEPGVAPVFPPMAEHNRPLNRLDFARWITAPENPLTARVAVNRYWAALFGQGIVTTLEDFGSQGGLPSHPELLDWLAGQFSGELGWSTKQLLRLMVTSETYQQSSTTSPALLAADPYNELLARGPRKRLSAEEVRDQILAVSGLLSDKMYGPGVMPPQPDGLWDGVVYSGMKWITSEGEDRYRRGIYTYLRRSVPHPFLTTFDGPNREVCLSRRTNTNTPLQALMTLNDPVVVEAANALARDLMTTETSYPELITAAHQRVLFQAPAVADATALLRLYNESLVYYHTSPTEAEELVGSTNAELAALTVVVNALFNLDEFISKA